MRRHLHIAADIALLVAAFGAGLRDRADEAFTAPLSALLPWPAAAAPCPFAVGACVPCAPCASDAVVAPLMSPGVAVSLPCGVALGAVLTSRLSLFWLAPASARVLAGCASGASDAADALAASALLAEGFA
jgi:hypothetical protein